MAGPANQKPRAFLDGWKMERKPPEGHEALSTYHLVGVVYGHPKVHDGDMMRTSPLVKIDFKDMIAETENTIFSLGKMKEKE